MAADDHGAAVTSEPTSAATAAPVRRARSGFSPFGLAVTLLGLLLLYLAVPSIGPVVRAATPGAGDRGVFTAERLDCVAHAGHRACDWFGTFQPQDGAARPEIALYGGEGAVREGQRVTARDVGRPGKVYRHDGSREWVLTLILAAAGLYVTARGVRSTMGRKVHRTKAARSE